MSASALAERPELASHIATIAALWSEVEHGFGGILGLILDADRRAAMTLYVALTGSASRDAALRAMARDRLSQQRRAELEALLKAAKGPRGERNDIIHGLWGHDRRYPDQLILMPPDEMTKWAGGMLEPETPGDPPEGPKMWLYSERDFVATEARIRDIKAEQIALGVRIIGDRM